MPGIHSNLPSYLLNNSFSIVINKIPVLIGIPESKFSVKDKFPWILWMHGRTANKEIDPGRYLRLLRNGIGFCAVDLPGHGERSNSLKDDPSATLDIIKQMSSEIDYVFEWVVENTKLDSNRSAVGGMSAGGMAAIDRLVKPHSFKATALEATTGNWEAQSLRPMFSKIPKDVIKSNSPIHNLENWTPLSIIAVHSIKDEWIDYAGQKKFIDKLKEINLNKEIKFISYDKTGAPYEHIGFGKRSAESKDNQVNFLLNCL